MPSTTLGTKPLKILKTFTRNKVRERRGWGVRQAKQSFHGLNATPQDTKHEIKSKTYPSSQQTYFQNID